VLVFAPEIDRATRAPGHLPERSPVVVLRSLHASLHAGRVGTVIVGGLGLALVAESVTGLWLYGPAVRHRPRSRAIHRILGAVSLAFAGIVGLSGVALTVAAFMGADGHAVAILRRAHYGDFAGWASRIGYAAAGVTIPLLAITGYLIVARRHD
jgi:uncharacterized iron-regulated membrane protein